MPRFAHRKELKTSMSKKKIKAIEALEAAQKIAFAPFVFQTTVSLRKLGVLDYLFENGANGGTTLEALSQAISISEYGLSVLLEIAESSDIVEKDTAGGYEPVSYTHLTLPTIYSV